MADKLKKYSVSYRGEFGVVVMAKDEAKAIRIAEKKEWEMLSEGHIDFYEVEEL